MKSLAIALLSIAAIPIPANATMAEVLDNEYLTFSTASTNNNGTAWVERVMSDGTTGLVAEVVPPFNGSGQWLWVQAVVSGPAIIHYRARWDYGGPSGGSVSLTSVSPGPWGSGTFLHVTNLNERGTNTFNGLGDTNAGWKRFTLNVPAGQQYVKWVLGADRTASASLDYVRLDSDPRPLITDGGAYQLATGRPWSHQIVELRSSGGSYTATGLPAWLTLSSSGLLSGTPPAPGLYSFQAVSTNAFGSSQKAPFSLTVIESAGSLEDALDLSPGIQVNALSGNGISTWYAQSSPSYDGADSVTHTAPVTTDSGGGDVALELHVTGPDVLTYWRWSPFPSSSFWLPVSVTIPAGPSVVRLEANPSWSIPLSIDRVRLASDPRPQITSDAFWGLDLNRPVTHVLTATGNGVTWSATGLPEGVTLNSATGQLGGVPVSSGEYSVTFTATSPAGSDTRAILLSVLPPVGPIIGADRFSWRRGSPASKYHLRELPGDSSLISVSAGAGAWLETTMTGPGHVRFTAAGRARVFIDGLLVRFVESSQPLSYTEAVSAGAHVVRFAAPNDAYSGSTTFLEIAILDQPWRSDPSGDADGDGMSNVLEAGVGTDQHSTNAAPSFSPMKDSSGNLIVSFTKPVPATGFAYVFEVSTDLQSWTTAGVVNLFDNATTLTSIVARPPSGEIYARLRVTAPP